MDKKIFDDSFTEDFKLSLRMPASITSRPIIKSISGIKTISKYFMNSLISDKIDEISKPHIDNPFSGWNELLNGPKPTPNNIIRMCLAKRISKVYRGRLRDGHQYQSNILSDEELSKYKKITNAILDPTSIYYNIDSIDKKYKDNKYVKFFKRELNREMLYLKKQKLGRKL